MGRVSTCHTEGSRAPGPLSGQSTVLACTSEHAGQGLMAAPGGDRPLWIPTQPIKRPTRPPETLWTHLRRSCAVRGHGAALSPPHRPPGRSRGPPSPEFAARGPQTAQSRVHPTHRFKRTLVLERIGAKNSPDRAPTRWRAPALDSRSLESDWRLPEVRAPRPWARGFHASSWAPGGRSRMSRGVVRFCVFNMARLSTLGVKSGSALM
jgi:hypothetical protein